VTWFGGPGWGVDIGFGFGGGFGWCALGWGEPYYPWYHGGYNYFRSVNISNTRIVNINNYWGHRPNRFGERNFHYANMRAPGGITTAPVRSLQNGAHIRGTSIRVSARQLNNAPMGRVGISPNRNAMLGVHAGQRAAAPPARTAMRPVVSRMAPPASFNRGRTRMADANSQRPAAGRNGSNGPLTPSRIIPHGAESASGRVPSPSLRGVPQPGNNNVQRPGMNNSEMGRNNNPQTARNIPRPPNSMNSRDRFPADMGQRPVARPQGGFGARDNQPTRNSPMNTGPQTRGPESNRPQPRGGFSGGSEQRSVPRPPANIGSRENRPTIETHADTRSGSFGNRPTTSVPRPTGPVRQASESDRFGGGNGGRPSNAQPAYRGGYSGPSRSTQAPRSESPRYSAPPSYRNSGPSDRGSAPSYRSAPPSYRGESPAYRAPSPSYGGGSPSYRGGSPSYRSGSPSYRGSMPSYGGGTPSSRGGGSFGGYRGGSSPSYHGGGGGMPSSHGGGGAPSHGGGGGGSRSSSSNGHGGHR
jgi:hypothetical protein